MLKKISPDAHSYFVYFEKEYKDKLTFPYPWDYYSDRYNGFRRIFETLLAKKPGDFTIIETGTLRTKDQWSDGQSSRLFYEFLNIFGGKLITIDIDPKALSVCRRVLGQSVRKTGRARLQLVLGDSRTELTKIDEPVDLVYLDSLDVGDDPEPAMQHALQEFKSLDKIVQRSPGLLVAIDDNRDNIGKGKYPLAWAKNSGQQILHDGYQILFRMR